MNRRSIETRLIVGYVAIVILSLFIIDLISYTVLDRLLYDSLAHRLQRRVAEIETTILKTPSAENSNEISHRIEELYRPESRNRFILIESADGDVIYRSKDPDDHSLIAGTIVPAVLNHENHRGERLKGLHGIPLYKYTALIIPNNKPILITLIVPADDIELALKKMITTLGLVLPLVIFLVVASGAYLVRFSLHHIELIRMTAEKISFQNVRLRLPVISSGDTFENLTLSLNRMLERLETSYDQAKRFAIDASHELRTPLAVIRSELELMLNQDRWTVTQKDKLESILEEAVHLSNLIEGLLSLTHIDSGDVILHYEDINVRELVVSTVDQMNLIAFEKNIPIHIDAEPDLWIKGDSMAFKRILINILDNALKYTTSGGVIDIILRGVDRRVHLEVRDRGIGISVDAQRHVFERFYRVNRPEVTQLEGSGLGLSIVKALCLAQGGTVSLVSQENIGTTVIVDYPRVMKTTLTPHGMAA